MTKSTIVTAEDFADAVMLREHRRMTTGKWERMRTEDIRAESFADVSITTVRKAANAARDKGLIEDTSHHDGRREWRVSRSYLHARIAEWIDDARPRGRRHWNDPDIQPEPRRFTRADGRSGGATPCEECGAAWIDHILPGSQCPRNRESLKPRPPLLRNLKPKTEHATMTTEARLSQSFAVFNLHVNDAGKRADAEFRAQFGDEAFEKHIAPRHAEGIMSIFGRKPNPQTAAWVALCTAYANEKPPATQSQPR